MLTADRNVTVYLNGIISAYVYQVPTTDCSFMFAAAVSVHHAMRAAHVVYMSCLRHSAIDLTLSIVLQGAGHGFVHACTHAATGI